MADLELNKNLSSQNINCPNSSLQSHLNNTISSNMNINHDNNSSTPPKNLNDLLNSTFYYSSDDNEEENPNPDPFYDENIDIDDEIWVNKTYLGHYKQKVQKTNNIILSCPYCFTQVCFDCQRHQYFNTQYRAIFVENVEIRDVQASHGELSVFCSECHTELGAKDKEGIYHFFHVLN